MKIGRGSCRSIRYSVFIGVLAGSVFSGSGAFADIPISSQTDLAEIGSIEKPLSGDYYLANSFEITNAIDGATYIAGSFTGSFDGKGNTISYLVKPLFDVLDGSSAEVRIKNLILETTGTLTGSGILANTAHDSTIESVTTRGSIGSDGANIGGLIGTGTNLIINDVHTLDGTLTNMGSSGYTGGIIGMADGLIEGRNRIVDSTSSLTINSNSVGVGGLVGNLGTANGSIEASSYSGNVTGNVNVGGLVGINYGSIERSVTAGSVTANSGVGGLVGLQSGGEIINSASSATVTVGSSFGGGLIGQSQAEGSNLPSIENSHSSGQVNGGTWGSQIGGLIGQSVGTVSESWSTGRVTGREEVGGLIGNLLGDVNKSFASGDVSGITDVGGLVGKAEASNPHIFVIQNSYATGNINLAEGDSNWSSAENVGGLIGSTSNSRVVNTYATGDVGAMTNAGGLIGRIVSETQIGNAFATGNVYVTTSHAGGLVGTIYEAELKDVIATGSILSRGSSSQYLGGLVGYSQNSEISYSKYFGSIDFEALTSGNNSNIGGIIGSATSTTLDFVHSTASINTNGSYVGGLIGNVFGGTEIKNATAIYTISGYDYLGGLVGYSYSNFDTGLSFQNSFGRGTILSCALCLNTASYVGTLGLSSRSVLVDGISTTDEKIFQNVDWEETVSEPATTSILKGFSSTRISTNTWAICAAANGSLPYLIALFSSDPCSVRITSRPERNPREVREITETRFPDKIEKSLGFKNETPLPKNAPIAFVETTEKIELAKIKAVEIAPTANVKVSAKTGEALQISLKSESKEPVELWVKSPDGSWLLAGVITFNKDGKAILPPLQFKSAGDYTLVLNKPSTNSAKGSAPLNQSGSVLVAVS